MSSSERLLASDLCATSHDPFVHTWAAILSIIMKYTQIALLLVLGSTLVASTDILSVISQNTSNHKHGAADILNVIRQESSNHKQCSFYDQWQAGLRYLARKDTTNVVINATIAQCSYRQVLGVRHKTESEPQTVYQVLIDYANQTIYSAATVNCITTCLQADLPHQVDMHSFIPNVAVNLGTERLGDMLNTNVYKVNINSYGDVHVTAKVAVSQGAEKCSPVSETGQGIQNGVEFVYSALFHDMESEIIDRTLVTPPPTACERTTMDQLQAATPMLQSFVVNIMGYCGPPPPQAK